MLNFIATFVRNSLHFRNFLTVLPHSFIHQSVGLLTHRVSQKVKAIELEPSLNQREPSFILVFGCDRCISSRSRVFSILSQEERKKTGYD